MTTQIYSNINVRELENATVEITGQIPEETLARCRVEAVRHLSNTMHIDGFRQGHIPEHIIRGKIGDMGILEETAEIALQEAYPAIIHEHHIDAIGKPHITLTKLAPGNPLEFKATTAVMPKISLPNYKAIAQKTLEKKEDVVVEEKDVEDAILQIRKAISHAEQSKNTPQQEKTDIPDENLLPLDDAMVQKIGAFKDVADFTEKMRQNIHAEKTQQAKEKKRMEIIEAIVAQTPITLPQILIDSELGNMFAQFAGDVERADIKVEEYLKHINKTIEDLRKEWLPDAEKRSKTQLVLNTIAEKEHITVPEEELSMATTEIMKRHKDAKEENVREYVQTILINNKVFDFLEKA